MTNKLTITIIALVISGTSTITAQQRFTSAAACDNEDFEATPPGVITTSTDIQGWTAHKLAGPVQHPLNNCNAITNGTAYLNPTGIEVISPGIGGYIDTNLHNTYRIFSVFGSGPSNGGLMYNPGLDSMRGSTFIRINPLSGPYQYHFLEKSIPVTASNCLFRVATIPVLHKGGSCCDMPAFKMVFFNTTAGDTLLPCPTYSLGVGSAQCVASETFITAGDSSNITPFYYQPWRIRSVDLSPYIGSTLKFRAGVTSCTCGGKNGYAYIDAQCGPLEILVNDVPFPAHTDSVSFLGCGLSSATVVAPPDFSAYDWKGPGGFTSTLSTITTTSAGIYTLNIKTSETCSVITKYVHVNIHPRPVVTASSSKPLLCNGQSAVLTATGLSTYNWNVQPNTPTLVISPPSTVHYTVSGLDQNGCFGQATITQTVIDCTGIEFNSDQKPVVLFPNPNSGEFVLDAGNNCEGCEVLIYDVLGALVQRQWLGAGENNLRLEQPSAGIYYYTIQQGLVRVQNGKVCIQ